MMSPGALRAHAVKWMLEGFKASGRSFHGENFDATRYPSLKSMLETHFETVYATRSKR